MHWLFLLLALLFLAMAMKSTAPGWLVVLLVLASLVLLVAWILGWLASRISQGARDDTSMISPEELRQLRQQAEARKNAAKPEDTQT
jgi:uncharacterized protein (DUF58 family)